MILTNQEIFNLNELLEELNIPASFKFNYMVKRNKDKFKSLLKKRPYPIPLNTPEYKKFLDSCEAKVKEEGLSFKSNKEYGEFYQNEIQKEEFKTAKEQREKAVEDFKTKIMKWEIETKEIELYTISCEKFPNNLTQEQFEILFEYFAIEKEIEKEEEKETSVETSEE